MLDEIVVDAPRVRGVEPGVADAVYAELHVVSRRVMRIRELTLGVQHHAPELHHLIGELLGTALEALGHVPDVPSEHVACPAGAGSVLLCGDLSVSVATRRAALAGRQVLVVGREFDLLVRLAREPTVVVSKRDLLADVWGAPDGLRTRTVDTHASRIRRKLIQAGARPGGWVINHWGVGYSLTTEAPR